MMEEMLQQVDSRDACRIHVAVAIRVFDERERLHLSQILTLGARRTNWDIQIVPMTDADVVIFNPEDPGANALLARHDKSRGPIPVSYGTMPVGNMLHLPRPARSEMLIALLDALYEQLKTRKWGLTAKQDSGKALSLFPTHDFVTVLTGLDNLRGKAEAGLIGDVSQPDLLIDQANRIAWSPNQLSLGQISDYCLPLADIQEQNFRWLTRIQLGEILRGHKFFAIGLESLAWSVSFMSSPLESYPQSEFSKSIRLLRWPDFPKIQHKYSHVVWAGAMLRSPVDLNQLLEWSGDDVSEVVRFYNALLVSGLLVEAGVGEASTQVRSRVNKGRNGVLRLVLKKLGSH